jgi:LVIVD repeat-containing protein
VAWYQAGLAVFDISDPRNPIFVGNYDTWPGFSFGGTGGGDGDWGVWPFLGTDRVLVSDRTTGLYVLDTSAVSTQAAVFGLGFNPSPVVGGNQTTGTVFLVGLSPAGAMSVDVSSNNAGVPGQTVFIPAGAASGTFTQSTSPVGSTTNVTVRASDGVFSASQTLPITP